MKVQFSNINQRWRLECKGGVDAYIEGAEGDDDAAAALRQLEAAVPPAARQGMFHLMEGDVAAAIYGPVVFLKRHCVTRD